MGVVNVTPDSFSDGGRYLEASTAIGHGLQLLGHGADILDVGGESTRPGATRPLVDDELDRVVPVVTELARAGATVSVDTMRAEVARAAVAAGATVINDVSGGLADAEMGAVVAETGATYVAMHWRGHSDLMQTLASYDADGGVLPAVRAELAERVAELLAAGVRREQIVLDPGLGFAKTGDHNWELLRGLGDLAGLGYPLLVGASRKSFFGTLLADTQGRPRPVDERDAASVALTTWLAMRGPDLWGLRVHDVRSTVDALRVVSALDGNTQSPSTESAGDDAASSGRAGLGGGDGA